VACRSSRRAVRGQEHRPAGTLADGEVDRPGGVRRERDGDDLAALMGNGESPVAAFQIEVLDVGAGGLGDRSPFSASSEIGACSVGGPSPATSSAPRARAVERGGVRLVVHPRTTDVRDG